MGQNNIEASPAAGDLASRAQAAAMAAGAVLFGVADLTKARQFVMDQGGAPLGRYQRAISVGIPVPAALAEGLAEPDDNYATNYHYHIYEVVGRQLQAAALAVSMELQRHGYAAYPIPASMTIDKERLCGLISHKLAAHLAGLGYIGKSCLLVAPVYGGRVRFATVLTDAPLAAAAAADGSCGDCRACVDACPVGAFHNVEFNPEEPREVRFDAHKCGRYMDYREKTVGRRVCGQCVLACDGKRGHYASAS